MYLSINGDVPEVESSLSIHTSEECGVDGGPLDVIDILIVVLKRAEWMACLALREEGKRAKRGGREGRKESERPCEERREGERKEGGERKKEGRKEEEGREGK